MSSPLKDEIPHDSLMSQLRHGAHAMAIAQIVSQVVSLIVVSLLMRVLSPEEFGLVAMMAPLVLFLRILANGGLMEVAIRERAFAPSQRDAIFWTHVALGLLATLLTAISAGLFASFYDKPQLAAQLRLIGIVFGGTTLLSAIGMQATAELQHSLRQPILAKLRITAQIVGSLASLLAAWSGWGLWSLILGQYVEIGLLSITCIICNGGNWHWPRWDREIWHLLQSGLALTSITLVLYLTDNMWRLLTGRLIDERAVGLYGQAWTLMIKPVYLVTTPLTGLLLSGISRAQSNRDSCEAIIRMFYVSAAYLLMPATLGLFAVAPDVMHVVGGSEWSDAGPILRSLSCGIFAQAIFILGGCLLTAAGQMRGFLAAAFLSWILLTGALLLGWLWGSNWSSATVGLATGWAIGMNLLILPYSSYCLSQLDVSMRQILLAWRRPLAASLVMMVTVLIISLLLQSVAPTKRLVALLGTGATTYGFCGWRHLVGLFGSLRSSDAAPKL